jgi:predicted RNase H-like HicB family nuclease
LSRDFRGKWTGKTVEEARTSLSKAIALILEDRREDALRGLPPEAIQDIVVVESCRLGHDPAYVLSEELFH